MVTAVTSETFSTEVTKAKGIVVADFWAEWCGPCKMYGPKFVKFAEANATRAKFVKVNVEDAEQIASQFGVQSIPTTIFFKDGKEILRETGILSEQYLDDAIKSLH